MGGRSLFEAGGIGSDIHISSSSSSPTFRREPHELNKLLEALHIVGGDMLLGLAEMSTRAAYGIANTSIHMAKYPALYYGTQTQMLLNV